MKRFKSRSVFLTLAVLATAFISELTASRTAASLDCSRTNDNSVAIWLNRVGTFTVEASTYSAMNGWSKPEIISDPSFSAQAPIKVCVNDLDEAVAVWVFIDTTNQIRSVASSTLSNTGVWSKPIVLSGSANVGNILEATLSNTGQLTAIWTAFVGSNQEVFVATGTLPSWTGLSTIQLSQ